MTWVAWTTMLALVMEGVAGAAVPAKASAAFDRYVVRRETEMGKLTSLERTEGQLRVESVGGSPVRVEGGLIHDWKGEVFAPGVSVNEAIAFMQDYGDMARYYQPELASAKVLSRQNGDFTIEMRLCKKQLIRVVLDVVSDIHFGRADAGYAYSVARSRSVEQVEPRGDDGFLWRINTYWRFRQVNGGVVLDCEVISLTRDVPAALRWIAGGYVESVPREELRFTLEATRRALLDRHKPQEER